MMISKFGNKLLIATLAGMLAAIIPLAAQGQVGGGGGGGGVGGGGGGGNGGNFTGNNFNSLNVVGGIKVDASGVVRDASAEEKGEELRQLRASLKAPTGKLADKTALRMVSLKNLQQTILNSVERGAALPEEVLFLAGLQKVEYVFAYPEQNDIVIAGPAEPWIVREDSSVVGKSSGLPVLRLEDLLVALRTADRAQSEIISVSIEPTAEGQVRLQQLLSKMTGNGFNPEAATPAIKQAFGPQDVKLTAVPKDSRMAQTLVAADYQMKRLAMNLENSPIQGLPSYMEMIRNGGPKKGVQPRWWMTTSYDALLHSNDNLAWKISGSNIKALSEDQFLTQTGQRIGTGSANKIAEKWADMFTQKYDELCKTNSVFGDLRNTIDLNVVAAIIRSQQLEKAAGCNLDLMCGAKIDKLQTPQYRVPKTLDPQCSFVHGRAGWTISASGGVEINPWKIVAESSKADESVRAVYSKSAPTSQAWWWN